MDTTTDLLRLEDADPVRVRPTLRDTWRDLTAGALTRPAVASVGVLTSAGLLAGVVLGVTP